jgi:dihydrofolate reductase
MHIILMMAVTADGKIAKSNDHFPDWTSSEDKKMFSNISKEHGVVMMGDTTFYTLKGPLPGRLNVVFTLDENLAPIEGVKWVKGEPEKVIEELEGMGYNSAILGGGATINSLFLKKNLIDEMILTIEPKIFGSGLSLFTDEFNIDLAIKEAKKLNDNSMVVRYKVIKND